MKRNFIFKCFLAALLIAGGTVYGKGTPMEAFIQRMKEAKTFIPVSTIWQADNNFNQADILTKVEKAQPLTIDYTQVAQLIKANNTAISLTVPKIGGGTYTIDMGKFDFLTSEFKVGVVGYDGKETNCAYTPGVYYRGVVNGIPGSVAAFSFFNNEVYGIFSIPNEGNYVLVPNTMNGNDISYNPHYILYNDNDLKIKDQGPKCGTDQLNDTRSLNVAKTTTTLGNNVYNSCKEIRVYEFADYSTYVTKGHSTTSVLNYMTALFNNQSTLYRNEGILIDLNYVKIDTVTDSYQGLPEDSGQWLTHFGLNTKDTMHNCEAAIMLATKYGGAMGGVAWLQDLCEGYYAPDTAGPYAFCNVYATTVVNFPTYSWDVEVTTHEMGHTLGSPHTHRCCWNPVGTGTTAIDGCYTLEGTCAIPTPAHPVGGGTIMSYCHLTSDGINFSNGFGPQPGDTIRYYVNHMSCGISYNPTVALANVNRTVTANRECTDITSGITYYWNDNNTANQADDTLALMINKNGNDIGSLDDTSAFTVKTATDSLYTSGTGDTVTFPAGTTDILSKSVTMHRYWKITPTTEPTTAVEVMFPFTAADVSDVDGSVPASVTTTSLLMYKANSPLDPNPADGFTGGTSSEFSIYTNGTTPSATNWSLSTVGTTNLAHMLVTNLAGGGSGFYTYTTTGVENVNQQSANINVYPNPTNGQWFISVSRSNESLSLQLYGADGKLVHAQVLESNTVNTINTAILPTGMYFYRVVGSNSIYTGNLMKQ